MKYRLFVLLLALSATLAAADDRTHIVQKGDTVYKIARTYEVTPQEIVDSNGLKSADYPLKIGQRLSIPGTAAPSPQSDTTQEVIPQQKT